MDDTMKLWDLRNTKKPLRVWKDLTNLNAKTTVCISPDESLILTGTSVRKGFAYGMLLAYDPLSGD
jgi:WD repeat-containing protein 70